MLWVHAGSMARLEQSFRDIADCVKISGRQDPKANVFRLVHDWLRDGKSGQWLLILDNVDNPGLLSEAGDAGQRGQGTGVDGERRQPMMEYLPQSQNGSILVTSRSQAVALSLVEKKDMVAVQPMAPAQALALFEKKLGPLGQGNDTAELAATLEFMPLAIVQAAAYISRRAPRCSVQRYLEDFRKSDRRRTSLLNNEGGQLRRDWQARNSIIITWQISFEHIRATWPSAADLLSLMSFFDRQGIPEALVRKRAESGNGHGSQEELDERDGREEEEEEEEEDNEDNVSECSEDDGFEDDVQTLRDYSFLSVGTDRTFEMHALVQLATRKWLEANGTLEQWKQCYIKNLSAEFPTGEHENWTYCQTLFPHVKSAVTQRPKAKGSLRDWASLLHNAAWYAWRKGNISEAVNLSEIATKVRKEILGQEHEETLSSINMLGQAYSLGGRWKEAEELQVQVMTTSKRVCGEEHPNTLTSIHNLALTYLYQGRWEEAEELQVRVIEISKRVVSEEHPYTLTSMSNLASTYMDQGRWEEAGKLQVQVLPIRKKLLGEEHPDILTSMNNLSFTYLNQGRWDEAEKLQVQVITISKRMLGEEHPNTLTSISNLALIYKNQGRWEEAEKLQVQVMTTMKRVLGEEHPDMLISMNNLAFNWKRQGRALEAISLMQSCCRLQKQVLGPGHPYTEASLEALHAWEDRGHELDHNLSN